MATQSKINSSDLNTWVDSKDSLARHLQAWMQMLMQVTQCAHCVVVIETAEGKRRIPDRLVTNGCGSHVHELLEISQQRRQPVSFFELEGPVHCFLSLPLLDEANQFVGTVAVWDTVRHKEDSQRQQRFQTAVQLMMDHLFVKQRAEKAEMASRGKTDFASLLSHEIRTSVTAILGITDLLKENPTPSHEYIHALDACSQQLRALVTDVLDYNKMNAGKMELLQQPIRLSSFVTDLVTMYRALARGKGLKLNAVVEGDKNSVVLGDPVRLTQVLSNLLVNAIKFTEQGSVTLYVLIDHYQQDSGNCLKATFRVVDTGPGVSIHQQKLLFTPFVQATTNSNHKAEGTGLGLSIAYDLVRLMGGELCLKSSPGEGSTFFFHLVFPEGQLPKSNSPSTADRVFAGQRVLIVEDNVMNRMVIEQLLTKWNLLLTVASSGMEAIELIQRKDFDLLLMDVQMPGMNGYEATRRIRDIKGSSLPIIGLTGFVDAKTRNSGLQAGMNDLISKPLQKDDVFAKMALYLSRKH